MHLPSVFPLSLSDTFRRVKHWRWRRTIQIWQTVSRGQFWLGFLVALCSSQHCTGSHCWVCSQLFIIGAAPVKLISSKWWVEFSVIAGICEANDDRMIHERGLYAIVSGHLCCLTAETDEMKVAEYVLQLRKKESDWFGCNDMTFRLGERVLLFFSAFKWSSPWVVWQYSPNQKCRSSRQITRLTCWNSSSWCVVRQFWILNVQNY